jgi:hypothetical protein
LADSTGYSAVEESPLAELAGVTAANEQAGSDETVAGMSSSAGKLSLVADLPATFAATDPNAACPPTQAQVNAGLVACTILVTGPTGNVIANEPVIYSGQPTPAAPTLSATSTSVAAGGTVTLSDVSGASSSWWGNPTATTAIPAADVTVGGTKVSASTLSVSAATYTGGVLTPPALSGTVTLSSTTAGGTVSLSVNEPDSTAVTGNATGSYEGDVAASLSLSVTATTTTTTTTTTTPPPTQISEGYWTVTSAGVVSAFGGATNYGSIPSTAQLAAPIVGMAATPNGEGYWLVGADGGVFTFGNATYYGSEGGQKLNKPIVGIASTVKGDGYWLVASDGGVFTFGRAHFWGSTGGEQLVSPVVGIEPTPFGGGYWLYAGDGGVFAFGHAPFHGSAAGQALAKPITSMAVTSSGNGYWLEGGDGGIMSFGGANNHYYGSLGASPPPSTVDGIARTSNNDGYWLLDSAGQVYSYGNARDLGSPTVASGTSAIALVAGVSGSSSALHRAHAHRH